MNGMKTLSRFSLACLLCAALAVETRAAESWQQLKKAGQVADMGGDYAHAREHYIRALKLVPTREESSVVELEALLAADWVRQKQWTQAAALSKHILETVPRLKAAKRLDPEVLVNVKYLSDAYNFGAGSDLPRAEKAKLFNQYEPLSLALYELVHEEADVIATGYNRARGYIYYGQPEKAERALAQLLLKAKSSPKMYQYIQLAQAAVLWTLHKPQLIDKLTAQMTKNADEVEVLQQIADAHFYAANYDETDRLLNKALVLLAKKKPPRIEVELAIHRKLDLSGSDRNLFSKSEPHLRRIVEILAIKNRKSDEYNSAVSSLVSNLKKQKKFKEANAIEQTAPGKYDWLIEDEKNAAKNAPHRETHF